MDPKNDLVFVFLRLRSRNTPLGGGYIVGGGGPLRKGARPLYTANASASRRARNAEDSQ